MTSYAYRVPVHRNETGATTMTWTFCQHLLAGTIVCTILTIIFAKPLADLLLQAAIGL
jgi:hypothetical protein